MRMRFANLTNEHHSNKCERTYKHKSSLNRHTNKVHEKETNMKHKLQNPRSMDALSLEERPKDDHTNTGDFCCDSCRKTYNYKGNLERHIKLVH